MNYPRASELQLSCGPDAVNRLSGTILLVAYEEGALEKVTPFAACSLSSVCCLSRVTTFLYCVYFLVRFSAFMFDATRFHYMILFVTRMFVLHGSCSLRSIGSSNYNHLSSSIPILSVMPKKVMKHMNKRTTPWPAPKREGQKQHEGFQPQAAPKCEESRLCSPPYFCSKKSRQEIPTFGPLRPGPREHDRPQPTSFSSQGWCPTPMGRSSLSSLCAWNSEHHVLLQGTQGLGA